MVKKKNKTKNIANILLNVSIVIMLLGIAYGWMLTEPQIGETIDYNKKFIITDSDIDVKLFVLKNNEYIEQSQLDSEPLINIDLMEPGKYQRYRFDITNKNEVQASTNIIFTLISGDVDLLKKHVIFAGTNPEQFSFAMQERLEDKGTHYSFEFFKEFKIPAQSTISLNWYIKIDEDATIEIADTSLEIGRIMFVKP